MVAPFNGWRRIPLDDLQQATPTPHIVAFAIEVLTRRLALLLLELPLLLADPRKLPNGERSDRRNAEMLRGRVKQPPN